MTSILRVPLLVVGVAVASACGAPPPVVVEAPRAAPVVTVNEIEVARTAAATAFRPLTKRNFQLAGCDPAQTRIVATEAEAWALANGHSVCDVLAVHSADGSWMIVVRSGSEVSNPQARVRVAPGLQGIQKIDYAR